MESRNSPIQVEGRGVVAQVDTADGIIQLQTGRDGFVGKPDKMIVIIGSRIGFLACQVPTMGLGTRIGNGVGSGCQPNAVGIGGRDDQVSGRMRVSAGVPGSRSAQR